ncbi:GNAT family N-acetyltransferase [Actinomadura kijaniata]|uniref:GNAT superfamily N-acetyltransferase n=1 Tax=Actinomadura namibiensis TaxID=182080 RepID=A0A7W3LJI8_ACTNM|nr:GNAT family N-acetyltransferase [Actinomadura namibiensis]MBA8949254.1 GNAT superfamily N-acetyltransferase [Actinomadura namibiensis]
MSIDAGIRSERVPPGGDDLDDAGPFLIRPAGTGDLDTVLRLIDRAAAWLRKEKDTTQWRRPWPSPDGRRKRIHEGLLSGHTWLLRHGGRPVATVTLCPFGSDLLWTARELEQEAVYLHRLVIDRAYAGIGLGAELINWAGHRGHRERPGVRSIRIDVWSDNLELHAYYRRQGFAFVDRRRPLDDSPSGALFQKPIGKALDAPLPRIVEG